MKRLPCILAALSVFILLACNNSTTSENENTPITPAISYSLGASLPHDTSSFTEGIEFYNNNLVESTGNYGKSKLVEMDPNSGKVLKQVVLDPKYFGEGISVLHDTLYQMTYKEHVVFVYDAKTFKKIKELPLNTEGWGMTNDGKNLIVTDGSSNLFFYEPGTFRLMKTQPVTENGVPAVNINEVEYINGYVYSNQWQYNYILKIDPNTGAVVGKMDLTDLVSRVNSQLPNLEGSGGYLNGIAYNKNTDKIYITGKLWPNLFEIKFAH
jgi:glutaminyl-peptide cyclotransferase